MRDPAHTLLIGMALICAVYRLVDLACERTLGAVALGGALTPAACVLLRAIGPKRGRLACKVASNQGVAHLGVNMVQERSEFRLLPSRRSELYALQRL
jgi:hypothetical protein